MSIFLKLWSIGSLVAISATAAVADTLSANYTPVCFMQTETGQVVDLSHLCGPDDEQTTSQSQPIRQPKPVLPQQGRGRGAAHR